MKRIIVLILAGSLALSLAGCGNAGTEEENNILSSKTESAADNKESQAPEALTVSSALYPEMAPYPDEANYVNDDGDIDDTYWDAYDAWWEDVRARRAISVECADDLAPFFTGSIRQFLADSQGQNKVYSPLNVYMALGMLSEVTDGESRDQVLALLGADSVEDLREQVNIIWNTNYRNDGATTCILASSLWLNEDVNFVQSTLDSLAKNYYASSYQGVMGSDELNQALQSWLNEQTGGLLEGQASNISLDADTIMALATTVNFHAKWSNEFWERNTQEGVFHGVNGDLNCDFMHQDYERSYYWGEKFSAVSQRLESDGAMWFILPDEGVSVDELLEDEQAMKFLVSNKYEWEDNKYLIVHFAVPKFDVVSDMDLIPDLKAMGVTDIFDPAISDFTPMTTDIGEIYLSQAKHAARVKIDEEGCTAVAYTVMAASGATMPPEEEVDFVLDRPFIFVITGAGELPLFVGIVNQPIT